MTKNALVAAVFLMMTSACAGPQAGVRPSQTGFHACPADIASINSSAGKLWWEANRWRFASDNDAEKVYKKLAEGASPWPDWYFPYETTLAPGTRFQMAIGGKQTPNSPGSFGTFDKIRSIADVRGNLAVRIGWKPQLDRVVTYEVVKPVPVKIGPVGPQVDPANCAFLEGRWSQFQATVEPSTLITYLKVIDVRSIQ